eukprot:scaffold141330_cov52-Attheya_sp.AAC.1
MSTEGTGQHLQPPGVAAVGAPPAGNLVLVAPQLLFAADPGTITGCLREEMLESMADTIANEIDAVTKQYGRLSDELHLDFDEEALQSLASDSQ